MTNTRAPAFLTDLVIGWILAPETVISDDLTSLSDADWDEIFKCANQHRILPMMAAQMGKLPAGQIPKERVQTLTARARRSAMRQLALSRECVLVHKVLNDAGVPHLFLKGVFLAHECYPSAGLRPMRDIDVLVPKNREVEAWNILKDAGSEVERYMHLGADPTYNSKHLPALNGPSNSCEIEVHRTIIMTAPCDAAQFDKFLDRLWARKITFEVGGAHLPCPCPADMLLHLAVHGVLDHALNIGPLLLTDLKFLVETKQLDWSILAREAETLGVDRAVSLALCVSGLEAQVVQMGLSVPPQNIVNFSRTLLLQDIAENYEMRLRTNLKQQTKIAQISHIASRVFPSPKTLRTWMGVHRSTTGQRYPAMWMSYAADGARRVLNMATSKSIDETASKMCDLKDWVD